MKKIFLFFLLLFLSGCSIKYDLTINEDLNVIENIDVIELEASLGRYVIDVDEFVSKSLQYYKSIDKYDIYNIIDNSEDGYAVGSTSNSYLDFENYCKNSTAKDSFFKKCELTKDGNIVTINMNAVDFNEYLFSSELEESIIKKARVNIKIPYKVLKNNSDSIKDNIYTWEYEIEDYSNDINIVFDTSKPYRDVNYSILILGGIILVVIISGLYIYNKYKQNSKI